MQEFKNKQTVPNNVHDKITKLKIDSLNTIKEINENLFNILDLTCVSALKREKLHLLCTTEYVNFDCLTLGLNSCPNDYIIKR